MTMYITFFGTGVTPAAEVKGELEMNYNNAMKHHMRNLGRLTGNDVSSRYSYMISGDDLTSAYAKMRDELGYPLMMDSKYRRAIVYNKKGLEKQITKLVNEVIIENIKLLDTFVAQDIVNKVNGAISGSATKGSGNSFASMLGSALGKGIVKGIGDILDDMMNGK